MVSKGRTLIVWQFTVKNFRSWLHSATSLNSINRYIYMPDVRQPGTFWIDRQLSAFEALWAHSSCKNHRPKMRTPLQRLQLRYQVCTPKIDCCIEVDLTSDIEQTLSKDTTKLMWSMSVPNVRRRCSLMRDNITMIQNIKLGLVIFVKRQWRSLKISSYQKEPFKVQKIAHFPVLLS